MAPENASIVFEDDWTRAVVITLELGDELPMHHGEERIVYSLPDYTFDWTFLDPLLTTDVT